MTWGEKGQKGISPVEGGSKSFVNAGTTEPFSMFEVLPMFAHEMSKATKETKAQQIALSLGLDSHWQFANEQNKVSSIQLTPCEMVTWLPSMVIR